MSVEVGTAFVTLVPSAQGFAAKTTAALGGPIGAAGKQAGGRFGSGLLAGVKGFAGPVAALVGGMAIAGVVKDSITLRAEFSRTMATMGAVAGVPKAQLADLSKLAVQMGADTVYSANEAASAMLELAKGGLSAAQIAAGGLKGTLTLAAAGDLALADAATIAANALNTFGLAGKDVDTVAAALAGGANASTASVESLGQALAQVGPSAKTSGLSIQETVAALAAFDNAGVKGSDAGTSLKTMLMRLVPQTDKARDAMSKLGLKFTDSKGSFLPLRDVAQQLQTSLKGLSDEQKTTALTTIFGADAYRAAAILADQGAAGIDKLTKATGDVGAAQRVADARMSGLAGSLERLSGSWDTAKLALGGFLEPLATVGANTLGKMLDGVAPGLDKLKSGLQGVGGKGKVGAFAGLVSGAKSFGSSVKAAGVSVLPALKSFGGALLPTLKKFGTEILGVVGPALRDIGNLIKTQVAPAFAVFLKGITPVAKFLLGMFGSAVVGVIKGAVQVIKGVLNVLAGVFKVIGGILTGDWSKAWEGVKQIVSGALTAVIGFIKVWLNIGLLKAFKLGFTALKSVFTGGWNLIKAGWKAGIDAVGKIFTGGLKLIGRGALTAIRGYVGMWRNLFSAVWAIVRNGWQVLRSAFGGALAAIRTVVSTALEAVRGFFTRAFTAVPRTVRTAMASLKTAISTGVTNAVNFARQLPSKILNALGNLNGKLLSVGRDLMNGLLEGIRGKIDAVLGTVQGLIDRIPAKAKQLLGIASPSKVFKQIGRFVGEGFILGLQGTRARMLQTTSTLFDRLKRAGASKAAQVTKSYQSALLRAVDARDALTKRIGVAQQRLKDLQQQSNDYAQSARDQVMSTGNVTQLAEGGYAGLIKGLSSAVDRARKFRRALDTLRSQGALKTVLDQLVQAGPEQGLTAAQAILSRGKAGVTEVNRLVGQLSTQATAVGKSAAASMFGAGVDAAKGLVKGLQSQQKVITGQLAKLAAAMVKAIKKALGIKSPSRVFAQIGEYSVAGLADGLAGSGPAVNAAGSLARDVARAAAASSGVASRVPVRATGSGFTDADVDRLIDALQRRPAVLMLPDGRVLAETVDEQLGRQYAYGRTGG